MTYHQKLMLEALGEAERALLEGEVPIGALVIHQGQIVGRGRNGTKRLGDSTAHAEMQAIREACQTLERERLDGCTLYSTLEPCPMCAGAIVLSRIDRLIFGAYDAKAGSTGTLYSITSDDRLNHQVETHGGVLDDKSIELLQTFFSKRRASE